mmetsp:Transcript_33359/g.83248  ORF Transcript_33359/g.83248 Transcript_33359/m.83248 type:complete len:86 (+) Transcript_33359:255-512(+)
MSHDPILHVTPRAAHATRRHVARAHRERMTVGCAPALGAAAAPVTVAAAAPCHRCPRRPPPSPLATLVLTGGDAHAGPGEVSGEG